MAALVEGTDFEVVGVNRGDVYNEIVIKCIETVDAADTLAVDMTKYGIKADGLIGATGFTHTTSNSVAVVGNPVTSVSSGTVTLTVPAGSDNDARIYIVKGMAEKAAEASL